MNLCPCGARGDPGAACICTPQRVERYRERLSRALLDRFDLVLAVPRPRGPELESTPGEASADVRTRVLDAREHEGDRAGLSDPASALLTTAVDRLGLSARARARTARVGASIAALARASDIRPEHVAEALSYRPPPEVVQ
jgi:magnesium chelatase family protein